jgi:hypothetical protein
LKIVQGISILNVTYFPIFMLYLDRANASNRNTTFLLTTVAQSIGQHITDIALNRGYIWRDRCHRREQIPANIKRSFDPSVSLIIHWDGKIWRTLRKTEHVDRLAVTVSENENLKFLSVLKFFYILNVPDIALFKKLSNFWTYINQESFENRLKSSFPSPKLNLVNNDMVKFIFN